jgi:hypothetical protein
MKIFQFFVVHLGLICDEWIKQLFWPFQIPLTPFGKGEILAGFVGTLSELSGLFYGMRISAD